MRPARIWWLQMLCALIVLWCAPLSSAHAQQADACSFRVLSTQAAKASADERLRPAEDWVTVQLPDVWSRRWPEHSGSVWYRIDWERQCPNGSDAAKEPVAFGFQRIFMAAEVFVQDDRLWSDASLVDPITHGWNASRWWALPASAVRPGINTVWVRVVGPAELTPGIEPMQLDTVETIRPRFERLEWRRNTAFLLTNALSGALACIFCVIWLMRRTEHTYGWFALMSFAWSFYLSTVTAAAPWPIWPIVSEGGGAFESSLRMARLNIVAMVFYIALFSIFSLRFSDQRMPRAERFLWAASAIATLTIVLAPRALLEQASHVISLSCAFTFFAVCIELQWHAWRHRSVQNILMALCWASFLVVSAHDVLLVFHVWSNHEAWVPLTVIITTALIALLLGGRLAANTRKIEQFNIQLEQRVNDARNELTHALEREHAQKLEHTRLQERVHLAHDLHDSLGGSLVRSIAVVERAQRSQQTLPNERMLSLLKLLRDDLRQMIDHGSSVGATVPDTPELWMAPLRYRFTRIFDELNIAWQWHSDPVWRSDEERPSALQCLGLSRILEEALTNAIKHSRAKTIRVWCHQTAPHLLILHVEDDGKGFDVPSARDTTGLGVGMRSMAQRARRISGQLTVTSALGTGSVVRVEVALQCQNAVFDIDDNINRTIRKDNTS
ncbi:histidine kinase [Diaphorobacter sp. HDW4A]|uniref:sensor histidine kinase n=1 Tax=Diaphorobacter sp. HDW4A TaxID=2714924 RepID=UPI001408E06D|nr:ATP-binding protein [Diaphorobacter sp. HDW4A]QIL81263.1 histidine kinase [Diaphorobacter sp. HDW4A]